MKKVYADNAATSYPKAPGVTDAVCNYIKYIGSNIGRGTYESSYSAGRTVYETRELLAELFNFKNPLNIAFTMNITESLNMILKGFLKPGDHVIVTSMEHNAVMRPLSSLMRKGVKVDRAICNINGTLNPSEIEKLIKPETKMVVMTHASNVCGTILPAVEVGKICRKNNIYFVLDTAQTAGLIDIDFEKFNLSGLAFTGHKGLLGPQGLGGLMLSTELENLISPLIEGGTGSMSESECQPDCMPDKFESGTLNIPGIYGLNASLKYLKKTGINAIYETEMDLAERFINGVLNIEGIRLSGLPQRKGRVAVVSLDFCKFDNSEIALKLDKEFGIMTRVGLHCAPSAHKTLKTFPKGTVRFSFSHFTTYDDIDYIISSINKIVKS